MAFRVIEYAPSVEDYTLLADYHATTPASFDSKTVLHQLALATVVKAPSEQYEAQPDIQRLAGDEDAVASADGQVHLADVDVWVTNKHIVFFAAKKRVGVQVLYPSITITAQDGAEVLLELNLSPADTADEDIEVVQLRIAPSSVMYPEEIPEVGAGDTLNGATNGASHATAAAALFKAISNCQELNPDPRLPGDEDEEDEDGAGAYYDETAPGATGWITSENMADFMDENGNFRMPEGTRFIDGSEDVDMEGPAIAGSVRTRDAAELDAEEGDEENKWQRTG